MTSSGQYEGEIWKDIIGVDKGYQVSDFGRVRSKKYGDYRIIKPYFAGKKYVYVDLRKDNECAKRSVHRLVAIHFIQNPNNLPEVNHNDGNKENNAKNNLNWTDGVGNMKHAREVLGYRCKGEDSSNAKLTESDVREIIRKYKTGKYTYAEIAKDYPVHHAHLCSIVKRKLWKHLKIA